MFEVQGVRALRSGMSWMSKFEWSQLDPQRRDQLSLHEVEFVVRSSKTNARGTREVKFLVKRDSLGESMLIDCLANVAARAEYDNGEDCSPIIRIRPKSGYNLEPRLSILTLQP